MSWRSCFLIICLALSSTALAQTSRPAVDAQQVADDAIQLDGRLDEPAWASAQPAGDFVQFEPTAGVAPAEQTEARILIGSSALYVGMRMRDSQPEAINTRLARRDNFARTDYAVVVLDSYGDGRTGFLFRVTPGGLLTDVLFYDDVQSDISWDAVWDAKTSIDDEGWTAEFEIPLSQLRYAAGTGPHEWGLQLVRIHFRTGEVSYWSERDPAVAGYVSQFGTLRIGAELPAPRRLEVLPYAAAGLTRAPGDAADPFFDANAFEPRVGADVKLGLTSGLTLAGTVNPDFGQVEADPAQVNLGGFELFFEERRPFFVEGVDVFSMAPRRFLRNQRPNLLYTRRIGRAPQRTAFVPASAQDAAGDNGVVYTDAPQQTTILGAAKVSGQAGPFSVGLLNAVTRSEFGRFEAFDSEGNRVNEGRALIEPVSNYFVGRARGTFGQSIAGGFLTSVIRDTDEAAIRDDLPRTATVAGLDLERRLGSDWLLTAQAGGSLVTGSEGAILGVQTAFPRLYQRPDASHIAVDSSRTSLAGWIAEANLLKTDGEHWLIGFHTAATSPGFDANALGFQARADFANLDAYFGYQQNEPQGPFNSWQAALFGGTGWNFAGDQVFATAVADWQATLRNFWSVQVNTDYTFQVSDDRLTRGGPIAALDAGFDLFASVETDSREPVTVSLDWFGFTNRSGWRGFQAGAGVAYRPNSALALSLSPELSMSVNPRQYVTQFEEPAAEATFGRRYVFGELDATTFSLETRLDWIFRPDLSFQLFLRPFVSTGDYADFRDFDRPGALDFPVFGEDIGTAVKNSDGSTTIDPGDGGASFTLSRDFTVRSLQSNAVLRWEYRPGSTLFLVWQQQRDGFAPDGRLNTDRDVRGLFTDPASNVFLVKLSYWLG